MKKEIADMWVKALESGEYKQGKGQLRDIENNFCCLGVLCNLHAQTHPKTAAKQINIGEYCEMTGFLPENVIRWSGMSSDEGSYGDMKLSLFWLNDNGYSFQEIAQIIRENWEKL